MSDAKIYLKLLISNRGITAKNEVINEAPGVFPLHQDTLFI